MSMTLYDCGIERMDGEEIAWITMPQCSIYQLIQVEEGRYVDVELLEGEKDAKIVFDKIVMLVNGKKSKVGQPYVAGASVEGKIMLHDRAKKVIVYKQRPKKGYRKKQGHRQGFTRVMISKIRTSAKKSATEETAAE
jgi:large subunit ribosomal protein L21